MFVYLSHRDLKESLEEEEERIRQRKLEEAEDGGGGGATDSPGPAKDKADKQKEAAPQRSSLLAMKRAVRNGDMFTEEKNMFEEKYLVSELHPYCLLVYIQCVVHGTMCLQWG